jgi:hypothetical protein
MLATGLNRRASTWIALVSLSCSIALLQASPNEVLANAVATPTASDSPIRLDVANLIKSRSVPPPVIIDSVFSDASNAVAIWHSGSASGLVVLKKDESDWHLVGYADRACESAGWTALTNSSPRPYSGDGASPAPSADSLMNFFDIPSQLATLVAAFLSRPDQLPTSSPGLLLSRPNGSLLKYACPHMDHSGV